MGRLRLQLVPAAADRLVMDGTAGPPARRRWATRTGVARCAGAGAVALVALVLARPAPALAARPPAGGPPALLTDDGGNGNGQGGNGNGQGEGKSDLQAVLTCVTTNVGSNGAPTSYTAVWAFSGVPQGGSVGIPPGWDNTLAGGTGTPPGTATNATWTSTFTQGTSTWHFHNQVVSASSGSAPCSPAPQVPEVPTAVVAPIAVAAGLGIGAAVMNRSRRRRRDRQAA